MNLTSSQERKIVRSIGIVVAMSGAFVLLGWIFDIPFLKSIHPTFVTMKVLTAISFVFSGAALYVIGHRLERPDLALVTIPFLSMMVTIVMGLLFVTTTTGVRSGLEDLFVREQPGAVRSVLPGQPSLVTMFAFLTIVAGSLVSLMRLPHVERGFFATGVLLIAIGGVALVGYALRWPLLYYQFPGISTAMAIHTAILFALVGVGFVLLAKATPATQPSR
jgi:hypothetical protein